jgi:hypothetical protein
MYLAAAARNDSDSFGRDNRTYNFAKSISHRSHDNMVSCTVGFSFVSVESF